jgi:hypothetical protein
MSEEAPKPAKVESKEGAERPPLYRTLEHEVLEKFEDGSEKIREVECNGLKHRQCVDVWSYNAAGDVIGFDQISQEDLGPCDGKHS